MAINEDYLRFDADSMKRLITQKLSQNPNFTDQIFQDSNLTTLIDVFSYMYDTLTYYLNNTASESMFTDSNLYENINRIVKMLGYNPTGYVNPVVNGQFITKENIIDNPENSLWTNLVQWELPKYTSIDSGLSDSNSKPIFYSSTNILFLNPEGGLFSPLSEPNTKLVNGRWKLYERTFTSAGIPFESFNLDALTLDDDGVQDVNYISHPYVDVYVKRINPNTNEYDYIKFDAVSEGTLFTEGESIFSSTDKIFELRINEKYEYVLTFGDDIHGSKLKENDEIYIVYLEGNGEDAEIEANIFNESSSKIYLSIAGLNSTLYNKFINVSIDKIPTTAQLDQIYYSNTSASTQFIDKENVLDIRTNAPNWFRMGQRLITKEDFNQYVSKVYREDIYDVYTMNNWEYLNEFLGWLNSIRDCEGGTRLKPDIRERDYLFTDSCDFNNVYIWCKFKGAAINSAIIEQSMTSRKCLTAEPVILNAIDANFVPCLSGAFGSVDQDGNYSCIIGENGYDYRYVDSIDPTITGWDPNIENFIEISKDNKSPITIEKIKSNAESIIVNFFAAKNNSLGEEIDFRSLYNDLISLEGVSQIKTVFERTVNNKITRYEYNGLSFAVFSKELVAGEDKYIVNGNVKLKKFQFPTLLPEDSLSKRIKVIYESFSSTSIEY